MYGTVRTGMFQTGFFGSDGLGANLLVSVPNITLQWHWLSAPIKLALLLFSIYASLTMFLYVLVVAGGTGKNVV